MMLTPLTLCFSREQEEREIARHLECRCSWKMAISKYYRQSVHFFLSYRFLERNIDPFSTHFYGLTNRATGQGWQSVHLKGQLGPLYNFNRRRILPDRYPRKRLNATLSFSVPTAFRDFKTDSFVQRTFFFLF